MGLRLLKNEEDTKLKIVAEYLRSLGFDDSELFYEESFYFKAGRFTFRVDTGEEVTSVQPRLDILIKRKCIPRIGQHPVLYALRFRQKTVIELL